jgi:hypothetical protein
LRRPAAESCYTIRSRNPAASIWRGSGGHQPAVPKQEFRLGRDHIRRIAGDDSEAVALDRLEEAAEPQLDVVDSVQSAVEGREVQRSRVDVGGDDASAVARGEDRLDPTAGADVERGLDGSADRQVRECERRPVHAGDVVGAAVAFSLGAPVGRNQQLVVRYDAYAGAGPAPAGLDDAERLHALERKRGERAPRVVDRDRGLEHEQLDYRAERLDPRQPAHVERNVDRAGEQPPREPSTARTPSPVRPAAESVAPTSVIAAGSPSSSGPLATDGLQLTGRRLLNVPKPLPILGRAGTAAQKRYARRHHQET